VADNPVAQLARDRFAARAYIGFLPPLATERIRAVQTLKDVIDALSTLHADETKLAVRGDDTRVDVL
jgi:hypothetical protein